MSKLISELRISSEAISKTLIMLIKTEDNSNQNDLINLKKISIPFWVVQNKILM